MTEATHRYTAAKGYFQSGVIILRSPDRTPERAPITLLSLCMLTAFSLELYYKAWLLASGKPSTEVKAYGHRLDDLLHSCVEHGLPVQPELGKLTGNLMEGHKDFTYRYMEEGGVVKFPPDWDHAFAVLGWLDTVVDEMVGASAAHGLQPGHH